MRTGPERVLKFVAIAMGGLVVVMAAIELQDAITDERALPVAATPDEPLRAELARCRALTPDELVTDTACREAWAENRRRFFDGVPPRDLDK
ncbi:putative entry exclusion protein TrbK-alt [Afifella pfennigii]|uniref:putative entry exclusion protein TrbK-alt n=1 Tax=Afifella pfennigii TaxID=209897 RepID=UPI00068B63EE|nr:putative entry exclusion protein TrbK-alt [Afifella pfennigii]